jgi:hypothetical protein
MRNITKNPALPEPSQSPGKLWRRTRQLLIAVAVLITLVALFYAEENWRGRRAWERCKRELEAKGAVLDWSAFIPQPVPDEQNIFKAPSMTEWFVRATPQTPQISTFFTGSFSSAHPDLLLAQLTIETNNVTAPTNEDTLILRYNSTNRSLASFVEENEIAANNHTNSRVTLSFEAERRLGASVSQALRRATNASSATLHGAQGFRFAVRSSKPPEPVKIIVRSDKSLSGKEVTALFSKFFIGIRADSAGPHTFRLFLSDRTLVYSASEYLAWSDRFNEEFDAMRKALQRPYARIDGDYSHPISMPIPNFVTFRQVAQILAQRAQCHLLTGHSSEALDELRLIREICRMLEAPPSGKPMTLVSAMIDVAIHALYVSVVADGVRLKAWKDGQLKDLQAQMASIKLAPNVMAAFRQEKAATCRTLEITTPWELQKILFDRTSGETDRLGKIAAAGPRGWYYQNMRRIATYTFDCLEGFDETRELMFPEKITASMEKVRHALEHRSPYNYIAAIAIPNLSRAWQATARTQAFATEGQIVCALERYHNVHQEYPDSLNGLLPDFIENIPHDVIGQEFRYHRSDSQFLLYSPGWDQVDGGGESGRSARGVFDPYSGDWVWFEQQ